MSLSQNVPPPLASFNPETGYSAPRPWDAPGARYGVVTVGSYYTVPGGTVPEVARAIYVGTGSGNMTFEMLPQTTDGVIQTTTIVGYPGQWYPLLSTRVTAITGTLDNLIWAS